MRRVLFCPSDKGTIQKVIVLPSNHSLHDDLILEELEVFKVCSLYFSLLSFFSSFTLIPFLPLNQRQGLGGGCVWPLHKDQGQTDKRQGGIWEMDVL